MRWVRGEGIPEENITPWELLLFFFNRAFSGMFDGFAGKQDFLYKEYFRVPVNQISAAETVASVWDAVNDPILGGWMDKKRFGPRGLRNIMRISAVVGTVFAVLLLIDGDMTHLQRLIMMASFKMVGDITGTMNAVASQKMRAGISPSTQQRGRIDVWGNMGASLTWAIGNLPQFLMSFTRLTDYQIIFIGALIFMPFGIAAHILPTFIRQRVDYSQPTQPNLVPTPIAPAMKPEPAENESGTAERPAAGGAGGAGLLHSFAVVRHNRYFIVNSIASFITVFSPDMGDELMIYRYLMPTHTIFGEPVTGEFLLSIKQLLSGTLSNILQPFHRQIINKVGGPLRAQQLKCLLNIFNRVVMYFGGYKTLWSFALIVLMESIWNATFGFDGVAGAMMNYQWYDYVELKTGERSEGVTTAVNNLFSKIVTNNIGRVTGNAFLDWTGYTGGYKQDGIRPPERFLKSMWPMYTLIPALDHTIWFIARLFVKWTPEDAERTELALAERRAALKEMTEETVLEVEP